MTHSTSPLGTLTPDVFLRDYWQKKPLLIRNAFTPDCAPLSADELAGLACEEEVESRLICFNPADDQWQMEHGPFDEARFGALPPSHWTLLVQGVDHWVPEAHALLRRFNFIPNWRVDDLMVSYAVKGGGVGPHYDNYDVFLIQVSGQRRWEVGGLYNEHSPRREDAPVMILPEWQAEETYLLNPGDMLYLPPGIGHNGIAESDDCMTCSVGFRAPAWHELLSSYADYAGERIGHDARYTDPDLTLNENPGEITPQALERVRNQLLQYINHPEWLQRWFAEQVTEPKYPTQSDNTEIDLETLQDYLLDEQGTLIHNEGSRFAFVRQDQGLCLTVDGTHHHLDSPAACTLAEQLCYYRPVNVEQLDAADAQCMNLLLALVQQGALYPADDED